MAYLSDFLVLVEEKPSPKKTITTEKRASSGTPKQLVVKAKKSRSEVDRLLGDEGAIKMLYELKNSENIIEEKRKKTVISVEKTFKELAKKVTVYLLTFVLNSENCLLKGNNTIPI